MTRFAVWKFPLGIALWKLLFQSRQFALSEKWNENPRSGNAIAHFWKKNTLLLLLSRASLENIFRTRGYLRRRFDLGTLVPALTFFLFFFFLSKKGYDYLWSSDLFIFFLFLFFFYVKNLHQEIDDYVNIARENYQICNFVGLSLLNWLYLFIVKMDLKDLFFRYGRVGDFIGNEKRWRR